MSNKGGENRTYRFFKGPALADFMFVVVEQFLANLNHLMTHVFNLSHPLCKDTDKATWLALRFVKPRHIPTASPATKDLRHH